MSCADNKTIVSETNACSMNQRCGVSECECAKAMMCGDIANPSGDFFFVLVALEWCHNGNPPEQQGRPIFGSYVLFVCCVCVCFGWTSTSTIRINHQTGHILTCVCLACACMACTMLEYRCYDLAESVVSRKYNNMHQLALESLFVHVPLSRHCLVTF